MALWRAVLAACLPGSAVSSSTPHSGSFMFFSVVVGDALMQKLLLNSGNPIASIEMLGVACALFIWHDVLADRAVICFVDNEATKCCLTKGYSPQVDMAAICALCTRSEIDQKCVLYFERVASSSNIGDGPSRFMLPPPLPCWGTATRTRLDSARGARAFWGGRFAGGLRDAPSVQQQRQAAAEA